MRNWIDLINEATLVEASIPPTSYGYWITDRGEFIPVASDGGHYPIVAEYFDDVEDADHFTALRAGWIRIAALEDDDGQMPDLCADTYGAATGQRAVSALLKLAQSREYYRFYHCDDAKNIEEFYSNFMQFARSVREAVAGL